MRVGMEVFLDHHEGRGGHQRGDDLESRGAFE